MYGIIGVLDASGVSELECLNVTGPSLKDTFSDNRSAHSLISRGDGSRLGPATVETQMRVHRWGVLQ